MINNLTVDENNIGATKMQNQIASFPNINFSLSLNLKLSI